MLHKAVANPVEGNVARRRHAGRMALGLLLVIGQTGGLMLMTERAAHAYVDPGSGLLTLQMLGASLAGGFYFLRHKLRKLVSGTAKVRPAGPAVSSSELRTDVAASVPDGPARA